MSDPITQENLAATLAREMKQPIILIDDGCMAQHRAFAAVPNGYKLETIDTADLQDQPRRKKAGVIATELESFISYIKRHGSLAECTIWADVDYPKGKLTFTGIINDHGEQEDEQAWRDHIATFSPAFSEEWKLWSGYDKKPMSQADFATFIENNLKDIASAEGLPTGTQMLAMATDLEINQDSKFKSQVRTQTGGVRLEFISDEDEQTAKKMEVFSKFAIGLQVFRNGQGYQVEARLRYRRQDNKLAFWFELIRPDVTMEAASKDLITELREQTGNPFFFGNPFASR